VTYAADRLLDEVAYVAWHLHWPLDSILDLEHPDRRQFITAIDRMNQEAGSAT
jgi:hypothetical protein